MKVWKVVFLDPLVNSPGAPIVRESYWAVGNAKIEYKPGVRATAPKKYAERGYHPLAFNSLNSAYTFCEREADVEIWEAEADGIIENPPLMFFDPGVALYHNSSEAMTPWPRGTVMCTGITLTREVTPWKDLPNV